MCVPTIPKISRPVTRNTFIFYLASRKNFIQGLLKSATCGVTENIMQIFTGKDCQTPVRASRSSLYPHRGLDAHSSEDHPNARVFNPKWTC